MATQTKISKIVLDTVEPNDKAFNVWLNKNKVSKLIIAVDGPQDYPVVQYTGSRASLEQMILIYWEDSYLFEYIDD